MILICLALAGFSAFAENRLTAEAVMVPTDYLAPGNGTLTVTVTNPTDQTATDVRLSPTKTQTGESIGDLAPGESAHFVYPMLVTDKTLNNGKIDVFVNCKLDGKAVQWQTEAIVKRVSAIPQAEFSAELQFDVLREGGMQLITYSAKNTGEIALLNVCITDAPGNFSFSPFDLAPGESKTVSQSLTADEDAVSAAKMAYTSPVSNTVYELYAEKLPYTVSADEIILTLDSPAQTTAIGEQAHFTLSIENAGAFRYRDLSLSNAFLGEIPGLPGALRPGETIRVEISTPPVERDRAYTFTLAMRDESGKRITFESPAAMVSALEAEPVSPAISAIPGDSESAQFTVILTGGSKTILGARIEEKNLGYSREVHVLPAMREMKISVSPGAKNGEACRFTLVYEENGEEISIAAAPAKAAFAEKDREMRTGAAAALNAIVQADSLPAIVIALCALIVLITLLVVLIRKYRLHRAKELLQKQKRMDELSKTSKFTPVRTRDTEKEK